MPARVAPRFVSALRWGTREARLSSLLDLGWNTFFENQLTAHDTVEHVPARVGEEGRGLYRVYAEGVEWLADIAGKLRHEASSRSHLPVVGDWVLVMPRHGEERTVIQRVLARRSKFSRKSAGRKTEEQIVATNVDTIFLVSSFSREFNARRLERYLALAWESGAQPVVVLNKADLCEDVAAWALQAEHVAMGLPVHATSALTGWGMDSLTTYLTQGQTVALLGSSGVGKSTIINRLLGQAQQRVQPVRDWDDRGRHTTSSRQLFVLPGGGVVIDTPGLRELQLWDSDDGLEHAFADIEALAEQCYFSDCRHRTEPRCAVLQALADGVLDPGRLENFRKLEREQRHLERKHNAALRAEEQKRWKRIHKQMRQYYKGRK